MHMNFKRWRPELIYLIGAAIITRTWMLFQPNAIVFDEVYFKVFAAHYLDGHYFFDIHPPLGKLIFAGYAYLLHMKPAAMISGTALPLRVLPAIAGILLIPLIWGLLRRLGASRLFAFLGAFAVLLDNSLIVESRFILMDSMLILFGIAGVYFYLVARDSKRHFWVYWCLSALFAGASFSVKWTGLTSLALIVLIWSWDQRDRTATRLRRLGELSVMILIPIILYVSIFWIHFKLLPYSGDGDAFMTPQFQSTLIGSSYYNPKARMSFIDKFFELNKEMYVANATLTATHPYGSHWYMWPLEIRPIYYWEGPVLANGNQGNIYLLGNPAVYWGIWVAIITGLLYGWITKRLLRPATVAALAITGVGFLLNYLPFVPITRIMFQYHYFFAFLYSLLFAVLLWNDIATDKKNVTLPDTKSKRAYYIVLAIIALTFLFFAPLTYGTPLSPSGLQARMWLHSWR
jgi:dolichyl-phosphate-mannose-protein mannosyltransferase